VSEHAAFAAYSSHITGCKVCVPTKGQLCDEGFARHVAWRQTSLQQPPAPRKTVRAAGRPRERLEVVG
jgi:hypothetical protein